jgi:hypothetical protein
MDKHISIIERNYFSTKSITNIMSFYTIKDTLECGAFYGNEGGVLWVTI